MAAYDREFAPLYEANVVPRFRPVAMRLAELARAQPGERVLELAAGTGGLARLIAGQVGPEGVVVITDLSEAMLDVAGDVFARFRLRNVIRQTADLAAPPFRPAQFDLVVAQMSVVQERTAWLRAAAAQLRPGGRLAIAMWGGSAYPEINLHQRTRRELGLPLQQWTTTPRQAAGRVQGIGLRDVKVHQERVDQSWDDVADYLTYRRSFGGPPFPNPQRERFYRRLEENARRLARGGPLNLYWRVGYITASRSRSDRNAGSSPAR